MAWKAVLHRCGRYPRCGPFSPLWPVSRPSHFARPQGLPPQSSRAFNSWRPAVTGSGPPRRIGDRPQGMLSKKTTGSLPRSSLAMRPLALQGVAGKRA